MFRLVESQLAIDRQPPGGPPPLRSSSRVQASQVPTLSSYGWNRNILRASTKTCILASHSASLYRVNLVFTTGRVSVPLHSTPRQVLLLTSPEATAAPLAWRDISPVSCTWLPTPCAALHRDRKCVLAGPASTPSVLSGPSLLSQLVFWQEPRDQLF